ncbi:MAG: tripartite tricarboxylate transporter TctB family protein [Proteobacteria bacterium]|nr:tripartite tricarboxylate transporter TctB family protein [Pseudomonadota bacterium]
MSDDPQVSGNQDEAAQKSVVLELMFISFVGLVVVGAFIAALNYDFVSARAPLVIIVPLLILVAVQFNKTLRQAEHHIVLQQLSHALKGRDSKFNTVLRFIAFMTFLLLLIYVAGHYVGISVFMFVLMHWVSRERPRLALLVSVGVTVLLYFLFEHGFNIELYRGYIPKLLGRYGLF